MRKNWINWKRTPCGSVSELLCPLFLIQILWLLRGAFDPELIEANLLYQNATLQTPIIFSEDGDLNENLEMSFKANEDLMGFAGKNISENNGPCVNLFGHSNACPWWNETFLDDAVLGFTYDHCYESSTSQFNNSEIIALVHNNDTDSVGQKMEQELIRLYEYRETIYNQKFLYYLNENGGTFNNLTDEETVETFAKIGKKPINFTLELYETKEDLMEYVRDEDYRVENTAICFALIIDELPDQGGFNIEIMLEDQLAEGSRAGMPYQAFPPFDTFVGKPDLSGYYKYANQGYSTVHNWLANFALRHVYPNIYEDRLPLISHMSIPMSAQDYYDDPFSRILNLLAFFIFLMFIVPLYRITYRIVNEKETRARESMKMMGLTDSSYWLSWLTYYMLVVGMISLLSTQLLKGLVKTEASIVFMIFFLYGMSLFGYALIFQTFFTKARTAAGVTVTVYFVFSFFDGLVNQPSVPKDIKMFGSILSQVAVNRIMAILAVSEQTNGLNWTNIYDDFQNYTVSGGFTMMCISGLCSSLLGLYLDNVVQQDYGTAKKWNFIFQREFWSCLRRKNKKHSKYNQISDPQGPQITVEDNYGDSKNFEPVTNPELLAQEKDEQILNVQGLKKTFGDFNAVNGVNFKMYRGQIFALLGHNGAGKSTTISMLSGLIPPTEGQAKVFDKNLFSQMDQVRKSMGVCPQHDVLFDLLTPAEHLDVFCDFKGVDKKKKKEEIDQMLLDIDLEPKRDQVAKQLSGGNRRKLSVAIALVGGSKFILLDEPTAGMDLTARRKLWDMLKKYKGNRIIVLTTHYMDEADILGDRIGIMSSGKLICLGRSLFLKNRFGVGYRLNCVKSTKENNPKVGKFIQSHLGEDVRKLSEVSSEISFQIPKELSGKFKAFFDNFDQSMDLLGIQSYGISVTTLEEVFLKVGNGIEEEDTGEEENDQVAELTDEEEKPEEAELDEFDKYSVASNNNEFSVDRIQDHFIAVFNRRMQTVLKSKSQLFFEIAVPAVLVAIGLAFSKVEFFRDSPPKLLSPDAYPKSTILYNNQLLRMSCCDIQPYELMESLPGGIQSFNVTGFENTRPYLARDMNESLFEFDDELQRTASSSGPYRYGSYYVLESNNRTKQFKVASFLNLTSQDVIAYYPQFMYQSILRQSTGNPDFVFNVTTAPFPVSERLRTRGSTADAVFICLVAGIGFALIPASVIGFIVAERQKGLKHMQIVSGMNLFAYWSANLIFDIVKSALPCAMVVVMFFVFNMGYDHCWATIMLFPFGVVPFCYMCSNFFTEESTASTSMLFSNLVAGAIGGMASFILRLIPDTYAIGDSAAIYMKVLPTYAISNSIIWDASAAAFNSSRKFRHRDNPDTPHITLEPWEYNNVGGDVLAMGLHFGIGLLVVLLVEIGAFSWVRMYGRGAKPKQVADPDDDVVAEEVRVKKIEPKDCLVRVDGLRKEYQMGLCTKNVVAVEKTSFAVEQGECFALLGVNGAGKTTTFASLTRGVIPTTGDVTILGHDVGKEFDRARSFIGYCPQYDTIFDLLTVKQHLDFSAVIKGIPLELRDELIRRSIRNLNLSKYAYKCAGTLSGGNKRKLSVAMAMIGNPPVLLLDEPSAGMDPEARRFMWGVVSKVSQQRKQCGVIITTHSMEEAEALSTKMGIQVKGGIFRCFGSSQHIKNKFATGYEIEVKFKTLQDEEVQAARAFFNIAEQDERIKITEFQQKMLSAGVDGYVFGQLVAGGSGEELINEQIVKGDIPISSALKWLHTETFGLALIKYMALEFQEVEILEHVNDFYKLRVPKGEKTIGFTFGTIETMKSNLRISEYSVSQTTLEQIFQTFARLAIDGPMNKIIFNATSNKEIAVRIGENPDVQLPDSDFNQKLLKALDA